MRLLIIALIPTLAGVFAVPARAAERPKGGTAQALDDAGKRLSDIEKLLRAPAPTGEPSREDLVEECRSSFTVAGMATAVRGWMIQGSPLRGVLTGKGQFEEFSKKALGEVAPLAQQYQLCLAQVTGKRVCETMELLGVTDAKGGMQCGEPNVAGAESAPPQGQAQMDDDVDSEFVYAVKSGRREAARRYCEQSLADAPMVSKANRGPVCDAIIANFNSPAAACPRIQTLVEPSYAAQVQSQCPSWVGKQVGDARTCAALTGHDKEACAKLLAIREGSAKPVKNRLPKGAERPDPTCARPVAKMREWYCGRFSWPAFQKLAAASKSQTRNLAQAETADRHAKAIAGLKEVNDILARVVNEGQMAPLSSDQKDQLQGLVERRDRLERRLDDHRGGAKSTKGRHGKAAADGGNAAGSDDSSNGDGSAGGSENP